MPYSLKLFFPTFSFKYSRKSSRTRGFNPQIICFSRQSNIQEGEGQEAEERRVQGLRHVVLVERYGNGTAKRYVLDDDSRGQTFLVEHGSVTNGLQASNYSDKEFSWLPDIFKDFILPAGFPGSVSDDYLEYMLLQFPTNVTAWICHTLVTSSLLKKIKAIRDKLAIVSVHIDDEDMLLHTLKGLSSEYNGFKSAIRTKSEPLSLEELHALLRAEEEAIEANHSLASQDSHFSAVAVVNN
ncbi:hypothetical protein HHK36_016210 [Tetracentron sinense]|uniref:Protein root UVB sensitive/RUS domain-containing protein n=1 Tax=Tetracentron sinense TaxID=13715 RepID=A0A834Z5C0_TETSI|nr:hypothetical protein HHK36_016210 [Tetracentron sinense]